MVHKSLLSGIILIMFLLTGCSSAQIMDGDGMVNSYKQISQEEAKQMMEQDDGHVIVDVRRQDEYDAGHIPGAILIPNESIDTTRPEELPDPDQIILIYCRSGRRSKEAAQKLFDMGYTNIYEFGGILDWTGDIVSNERKQEYDNANHDYSVKDDDDLNVSVEFPSTEDPDVSTEPVPTLVIRANDRVFYAELEDNSSGAEFAEKLSTEAIEVEMHDYGNFEKVGQLPWTLEQNDEEITTEPGDVILYQGNQITIYYDQNTWNFTKLAAIEGTSKEELLEALGTGDVTVEFWVEWSE